MEEEEIEQDLQKIKKIYEGDLDFNTIKDSPILKPIAEINETFINLELMVNKALVEYEELQDEINKMVEDNPVYSETMLMAKIQHFKILVKQMIHSQDLQKANMIDKINEMIRIVEDEYDVRGEEEITPETKSEKVGRPRIEKPKEIEKENIDEDDTLKKLREMVSEEKEPSVEKEVESKTKYSNLVEREILK